MKYISDYRSASAAAYSDWNKAAVQITRYSEGKLYSSTLQTRSQPHLGSQRREREYSPSARHSQQGTLYPNRTSFSRDLFGLLNPRGNSTQSEMSSTSVYLN